MNRRSFIKLVSTAVAAMSIGPVEFLTPTASLEAQSAGVWDEHTLHLLFHEYIRPAIMSDINKNTVLYDKLRKNIEEHIDHHSAKIMLWKKDG